MQELQEMLFRLCRAPGAAGQEDGAAEVARQELAFLPEVKIDTLGSVVASFGDPDAKTHILLDAHLDQIGMVVTSIDEKGFLKVAPDGGMDRRVLPGSRVVVYGRETLNGIVCCLPPHLTDGGEDKVPDITDMAVDVGLSKEEAGSLVQPGDMVLVPGEPRRLLGSRVTGAALDDRAGCAVLIRCAQLLQGEDLHCRVSLLLSTREELDSQGARTAAFREEPDMAIVVDVSFAQQPGVPAHESGKLSAGPMIGVSPHSGQGHHQHPPAAGQGAGNPLPDGGYGRPHRHQRRRHQRQPGRRALRAGVHPPAEYAHPRRDLRFGGHRKHRPAAGGLYQGG